MDLRQLRQFAVLAETLSFRKTAERLNISQPPLSVSIRKLEEELGVALFSRGKTGVRLTESGQAALADARRSLFHAEEVARSARTATLGESGRLRIGFVGSATYSLIPTLLPAFRERYPAVKLELYEGTNTGILARLEANILDIGLVRVPFPTRSRIHWVTAERDHLVAALPAAHPLARRRGLRLADLADEPFVHYAASEVPGLHAITMLVFQEAGFVPQVTQEAYQVASVICLVESGLGVALVPSIASRIPSKAVVFRELEGMSEHGSIGLALGFDTLHETSTARRFREVAAAVLDSPTGAKPADA
jgi:DNA-binding transcriptional LysR family regulator